MVSYLAKRWEIHVAKVSRVQNKTDADKFMTTQKSMKTAGKRESNTHARVLRILD